MTPRRRKTSQLASLPARRPVFLVVHRHHEEPHLKRVESTAFHLLLRLQRGDTLDESVEKAMARARSVSWAQSRLSAWFQEWASLGWLCASTPRKKKS